MKRVAFARMNFVKRKKNLILSILCACYFFPSSWKKKKWNLQHLKPIFSPLILYFINLEPNQRNERMNCSMIADKRRIFSSSSSCIYPLTARHQAGMHAQTLNFLLSFFMMVVRYYDITTRSLSTSTQHKNFLCLVFIIFARFSMFYAFCVCV